MEILGYVHITWIVRIINDFHKQFEKILKQILNNAKQCLANRIAALRELINEIVCENLL